MTITRVHVSRSYVVTRGPRGRSIVVAFRLRHRARVVFTLVEVSPRCRVVGSFSVIGHRGMNRIRLRAGRGGFRLPPGTYRIAARTPRGRSVVYTTLLVLDHKPTRSELASALQANACAAATRLATSRLAAAAITSIFGSPSGGAASAAGAGGASPGRGAAESSALGAAGHTRPDVGAFSPANLSKNARSPLVIAALAAAVLLLGAAALPRTAIPDPRLTDVIVRHRGQVVLAGTAALIAAVIALAFG